MASSKSPGKITLGMMRGKSITTSVPVIRYHASDDELEELYPSTDDEKITATIELDKSSPKSSPLKCNKSNNDINDDNQNDNETCGQTQTDPWKMLSDIRGKITKTFEDKLLEIKNDKKDKKKLHRSIDNSSISDTEDLGDTTPTEDSINDDDKINEIIAARGIRKRQKSSSRFNFSMIKTGIKTKNNINNNSIIINNNDNDKIDDCVESGIEAAELNDFNQIDLLFKSNNKQSDVSNIINIKNINNNTTINNKQQLLFNELKKQIIYHAIFLPLVLWIFYYLLPLPKYITGLFAGIFITITIQKVIEKIKNLLSIEPVEINTNNNNSLSFVEILPVEEYSVIEKFEGWLNELPYDYDPDNYHVARTNTIFLKLENDYLKIMETRSRIPKRAVWNETNIKPKFTRKRVYSLAGATVELLPDGLTRRRRWSKKYPICVTFNREGIVENVIIDSPSDDEDNNIDKDKDKIIIDKNDDIDDDDGDDDDTTKDLNDIFEDCEDEDDCARLKIFIFGRTDRQKEDWYRRLTLAAKSTNKRNSIQSTKELTSSPSSSSLSQSNGEGKATNLTTTPTTTTATTDTPTDELSYEAYMARYTDNQSTPTTDSNITITDNNNNIQWFNAIVGRILFDMHKCPDMINVIQDKIQRKLSNIKLPYFMESLLISELVIGQGAPIINKSSKPTIDERGLWIDLDMLYECDVTMTVETKLNLMKLTKARSMSNNLNDSSLLCGSPRSNKSPMFDDNVEDSPETSTEDDDSIQMPSNNSRESTPVQSSGRKFLSMVDKLASNKYFQHAAELSYVRRAMEGVSNTEIRLMVSVSSIEGCLSINIPPSPSDRFWYGFKPTPKINLDARPAVGERAVNIGYVTNLIKTKLLKEFEKVVVLPNMDDLVIPLCPNFPYHI
ncbi:testis-expressed protein 2 [Aphidius gifuensis]|nr:testis-expressed protein 2 [Aphidius gifuensis]